MQKVTLWKKIHVIYNFFLVRKIIAHIVTFVFYCIVIPATVLVPEVEIPRWGSVYIPTIITLLNAIGTPRYQSFQELCYPSGGIKIKIHLKF
jgi:beta-mannan synthase